ncbi:MAG: hypothetical protein ACOCUP_01155 [bacterium]
MKKIYTSFMFLFIFAWMFGQTGTDKQEILQLCIEVPELQEYLVDDSGNTLAQLHVKANGYINPEDINIIKFGKPLRFVNKQDFSLLQDNSRIDFFVFDVDDQKARVDFTFSLNPDDVRFWVYMEFEKDSDTWQITKLKSEER